VVTLLSNIADCIEEWVFFNEGLVKALMLVVVLWASFGAGYYQGRKVAEREALHQLAKIMLEEKAAK
jgi:hypothetical protein